MTTQCPLVQRTLLLKRDPLRMRLRVPESGRVTAIECPFGTSFRVMQRGKEIAQSVGAVATFNETLARDQGDLYAVFQEPHYKLDIEVVFHFRYGAPKRISHENPQYTFEGSFQGLVHSIVLPEDTVGILRYSGASNATTFFHDNGDVELCRSDGGVMTLAHAYNSTSKVFAEASHKGSRMSEDVSVWQRKSCVNLSRLGDVYLSACNVEGHPRGRDTLEVTLVCFEPMVDGNPKYAF